MTLCELRRVYQHSYLAGGLCSSLPGDPMVRYLVGLSAALLSCLSFLHCCWRWWCAAAWLYRGLVSEAGVVVVAGGVLVVHHRLRGGQKWRREVGDVVGLR